MKPKNYYASGKLLLSAEYLLLFGAKGLALPLNFGQNLSVFESKNIENQQEKIYWNAYTNENKMWFSAVISVDNFDIIATSNKKASRTLQILLKNVNLAFWKKSIDYHFETHLEFNNKFGWGSSSTMVSLLSQATNSDPYLLYSKTFKGSGYDLACATADGPILFQNKNKNHEATPIIFNPSFKKNIFFVYLGKKQNSLKAISNLKPPSENLIKAINQCSLNFIKYQDNEVLFCENIVNHEELISSYLNQKTIKETHFKDIAVYAKSMGAWGGDFIMIVCDEKTLPQIKKSGFDIILAFDEIIKN